MADLPPYDSFDRQAFVQFDNMNEVMGELLEYQSLLRQGKVDRAAFFPRQMMIHSHLPPDIGYSVSAINSEHELDLIVENSQRILSKQRDVMIREFPNHITAIGESMEEGLRRGQAKAQLIVEEIHRLPKGIRPHVPEIAIERRARSLGHTFHQWLPLLGPIIGGAMFLDGTREAWSANLSPANATRATGLLVMKFAMDELYVVQQLVDSDKIIDVLKLVTHEGKNGIEWACIGLGIPYNEAAVRAGNQQELNRMESVLRRQMDVTTPAKMLDDAIITFRMETGVVLNNLTTYKEEELAIKAIVHDAIQGIGNLQQIPQTIQQELRRLDDPNYWLDQMRWRRGQTGELERPHGRDRYGPLQGLHDAVRRELAAIPQGDPRRRGLEEMDRRIEDLAIAGPGDVGARAWQRLRPEYRQYLRQQRLAENDTGPTISWDGQQHPETHAPRTDFATTTTTSHPSRHA